jgi:hypothetical protein
VKGICEYLAYQDLFEEIFKVLVDVQIIDYWTDFHFKYI